MGLLNSIGKIHKSGKKKGESYAYKYRYKKVKPLARKIKLRR